MTTLLLTDVFPPKTGGSGRWFWEIYRRLPRDQYVIAAGMHPQQAEFDRTHDLRVIRLPLRLTSWGVMGWQPMRDQWHLLKAVQQIIRDHNIEMLHCGACLPDGLTALFLQLWRRIPYLCYVHGEELNLAGGSRELRWWTRRILGQARLLIANSRSTAMLLNRDWEVPPEKMRVLYPGVDTQFFVPGARNATTRARLGWHDRPVVLTVGRLQKRKGQDFMILALHDIKNEIPNVLYAILGEGEEKQSLQELVRREELTDHVQFLGEISDKSLIECYQQCDLFALPNRQYGQDFEGFGMVLLEAQACGRPVLAGTSGGTIETMRIPETGCVVACDGSDDLVTAVVELLTNRHNLDKIGAAGRQWVVERFDWEALTREAQKVFHDFARNGLIS